jgi:hypothetical protein
MSGAEDEEVPAGANSLFNLKWGPNSPERRDLGGIHVFYCI